MDNQFQIGVFMTVKRGRYTTRQQEAVFNYMSNNSGISITVDEIYDGLLQDGVKVGKTTVYRALERIQTDGQVILVPDIQGGPARYCYMADNDDGTCMVCLGCHKVYPLACHGLDDFKEHVEDEHGFMIEPQRTILFGWCDRCSCEEDTNA